MKRLVVDTSVLVSWYLPEEFSRSALVWQEHLSRGEAELIVPPLHYWELGNVLRTYVRRHELEAGLAREIYRTHLGAPLEVVEPARDRVLDVALEYEATVYDAVFIELALSLDLPLLTAERSTTPWFVKLADRAIAVR